MSFLSAVTTSLSRAEQLRNAWCSLSYDILAQHNVNVVMSPPLTPESTSLPSRLSPSVSQSSGIDIGEGVVARPSSSAPAAFHAVRVKELHSTMGPYPNYIQVRNVSPNEQCSCCPLPVSMFYNGGSQNIPKNESCMQHRTLFPDDITSSERLSDHFFNSPRQVYQLENSGSSINNNNINNNSNSNKNNNINNSNSNIPSHIASPLKRKLIQGDDPYIPKKKPAQCNEEVACQVHGFLSLPGCREPRYNITVSELQRRVNQPECLTKVDMISYVRLAKNSARSLLDKYGINREQHNQRSEHTVLSKMCEKEAQALAKGIGSINHRYFPVNWFARKSVQEIAKNNSNSTIRQQTEALSARFEQDKITQCVLLDMFYGLDKRRDDEEMQQFNCISHTFGVPNMQNHLDFLIKYIEEEIMVLSSILKR